MRRRLDLPGRPEVELRGVDSAGIKALSRREGEVLSLAASGYLDKEICAELGVSPNTLRTYWARIRAKIGEVPRSALAVAYAQYTAPSKHALVEVPGADWELDLDRWVYLRLAPTPAFAEMSTGPEIPFEDVLAMVHPEDESNMRRYIDELKSNDVTQFSYTVRVVTPSGIETRTSFVRVSRDDAGRAVRLTGTRAPNIDLRGTHPSRVEVGYWERDLRTGQFTADPAFCEIFGIDPTTPDFREAVFSRFHPQEQAMARSFVAAAVSAGKTNARVTHRLRQANGSYRWATTDLRVERDLLGPVRALGVVMVFDYD